MEPLNAAGSAEVDKALSAWRQGDCVLGEQWFAFRSDIERPLTGDGAVAAADGIDLAETEVFGFMVLTQTCDIVKKSSATPFLEVSPLVEVDVNLLREIERGRRPSYAYIPTLGGQRFVADLDRVMTVEKSVVARWNRVEGWRTDSEARRLSLALARKRARFAFPDDFVLVSRPLSSRLREKHDKMSDEGRALRALREIRVRAEPSWDADLVKITFWFIRDEAETMFENQNWETWREKWAKRIKPSGRFGDFQSLVVTLEDLTARDYVESDSLDLDHLTTRGS